MEQDTKQSERNLWAIVTAGDTKYLGELSEDMDQILKDMEAGRHVILNPCYEIIVQLMQVRNPSAPQGPPILARNITCLPFCATLEDSPVWAKVDSIQFMADLSKGDQDRYATLIEDAKRLALQQRQKDANILSPSTGQGGPPSYG